MGIEKEKLDNSEEYIALVHSSSKGWITKAEMKPSYSQWHYRYPELLKQNFKKEDLYMSVNTFYRPRRRIEDIKGLSALFIDLDVYKKAITKEKALMDLQDNYFGTEIPIPSLTVDSGRGLTLMWLIHMVPYMGLPLWKAIEENFYNKLKCLGADRQALDATRVLRVPGSINSKSNTEVKILDVYDYTYDLREIQAEYLPEIEPKKKKKGRPKGTLFIYRERSLYYARIQDIIKICELREYDLRGHREFILFLYRYYLCYFTEDMQKALYDTLDLNMEFIYPLSENEAKNATESAEKVFKDKNKDYKYKNETLIELLDISEKEQEHLKTIIGKEEYKRRDREYQQKKYKEKLKVGSKLSKKEQILQRRLKIKDLLAEGLKMNNILMNLEISKRTYLYDLKEIKKQG